MEDWVYEFRSSPKPPNWVGGRRETFVSMNFKPFWKVEGEWAEVDHLVVEEGGASKGWRGRECGGETIFRGAFLRGRGDCFV